MTNTDPPPPAPRPAASVPEDVRNVEAIGRAMAALGAGASTAELEEYAARYGAAYAPGEAVVIRRELTGRGRSRAGPDDGPVPRDASDSRGG